MGIEVRRARPEDIHQLGAVHVAAWQWAYRGMMPDSLLDSLRPESRARIFAHLLSDEAEDNPKVWVAEDDGQIVGFITIADSRDDDTPPGSAELQAIYILEPYLGKGVGLMLHDAVEHAWREMGVGYAILWVVESNELAHDFYTRQGWRPDGAKKDHPIRDDVQLPSIRLHKTIVR